MRLAAAALVILSALLASPSAADIVGAARVIDGDTIDIAGDRIRFFAINTPERHEPGGSAATRALKRLIGGRRVRCEWTGQKSRRRFVSICYVGTMDLSRELVRFGYAAACPRFSARYLDDERRARSKKMGIWRSGYTKPRWCVRR